MARRCVISMPEMGESVTEGTVLEWHVEEGQQVAEGDTVIEVSTDKIDAEVPAPAAGTITKLLVNADDTVQVGQALAEMTTGAGAPGPAADPAAPGGEAEEAGGTSVPPRRERQGLAGRPPDRRREGRRHRLGQRLGPGRQGGQGATCSPPPTATAPRRRRAPAEGEAKPLRGPAAMLAKAMDE